MAHFRTLATIASSAILLAACGGSSAPATSSAAAPAVSSAAAKPSGSAGPATSASAQPANGSAAAKPAAGATKLLIIYSANSVDQTPAWAALDGGYFQQNGLDVQTEYVAGGTKTTGALIAGQAQVSLQGGNEAMSAVSNGADLVLIAGLLPVYGFKLEAAPGTDIKTVADLKGKKLGVSTIGGTADVALRSFLKKNGIDPDKDVSIIATGDPTTTQGALTSGAVQASLAVPPNSLIAEKAGTRPIADLASIPNAQNSVTVRRDWLNANKPVAQKLIDSLILGLARVKKDKAFTEGLWKTHLKYDNQEGLDYTYDFFSSKVWPEYPHIKAEQLADGLAVLSEKNDKLKNFDVSKLLDDSFVQDAEKRGVGK